MDTLEITWQTLWAADYLQTRQIAKAPDSYYEKNKFLGEHPSVGKVNVYFAASAAAHYMVSQALPPRWRETWQMVTIVYEVDAVVQNYKIGLGFSF